MEAVPISKPGIKRAFARRPGPTILGYNYHPAAPIPIKLYH
jgi:hypothetical protein